MRNDLRVVFDTNTLISAFLLPKSVPRQALDTATAAAIEITEVLHQPNFDRYLTPRQFLAKIASPT